MKLLSPTCVLLVLAGLAATPGSIAAQEPAVASSSLPPLEPAERGTWSVADGTGPTLHAARANAIEAAVMRVNGVRVATGPAMRSRLGLVKNADASITTTEGELEVAQVTQQLEGFVDQVEFVQQGKGEDGLWLARVRCLVAGYDPKRADFIILLGGLGAGGRVGAYEDLGTWRLQQTDLATGRTEVSGPFAIPGTRIGDCLVNTGRVRIGYAGPGARPDADSDPSEAGKRGKALVATHQVDVSWEPVVLRTSIPKPLASLPGKSRPLQFQGATVTARIRVRNLVEKTEQPSFEIPILIPAPWFAERGQERPPADQDSLQQYAQRAANFAESEVAKAIYFTLQPPVVLRKWQDGSGAWLVEADLATHIAQEFSAFELGKYGSLGGAQWRSFGIARLADGVPAGWTSTFQLEPTADAAAIVSGTTLLKPAPQF